MIGTAKDSSSRACVVLVHGLWMVGFELGLLQRRLEADGDLRGAAFSYPTVSGSMSDHVSRLIDFARAQNAESLHFVGHSLGGLVVLRALQLTDDLPPGRIVLLGTPLQGSKAAESVARFIPFGRALLGAAVVEECIGCAPREWSGHRDIGIIAGSLRLGLGSLFAALEDDHDGTVRVAETQLPGAKGHIVLRTTHTGMLFSPEVARQTAMFLREGAFKKSGP